MRRIVTALVSLAIAAGIPLAAHAELPGPLPVATRFGDFDHDTLALTWQPGFCSTESGCLPDQPKSVLIGLHGLWASRPSVLVRRGVPDQVWWAKGCDELAPATHAAPRLSAGLEQRLAGVMPHLAHSLLTHEYDQHVACFGFDPEAFFATELAMRDVITLSPFAAWLQAQTGRSVSHADALAEFERGLHTSDTRAVQFQCGRDHAGHEVLTQFWITLLPGRLGRFPAADTLISSPTPQDNCPATFLVPAWTMSRQH